MAKFEGKFTQIDPYECTLDELESEVKRLDNLTGFYETKQLALKKFINSVYGATASKYFAAHNTAVAESITLQGQDLNHFSERSVNTYFKGIFQNTPDYEIYPYATEYGYSPDIEYYKKGNNGYECIGKISKESYDADKKKLYVKTTFFTKLGITPEMAKTVAISKGKLTQTNPLVGSVFEYLKGDTESMTVAGDTDSVTGDTMIYIDNCKMPIEDAFTELKYDNGDMVLRIPTGTEIVPVKQHTTMTYNPDEENVTERSIKYIMRHKVSKAKYRITTAAGKSVTVTGDHSCMVIRDGKLIDVKANEIIKSDKIIVIK